MQITFSRFCVEREPQFHGRIFQSVQSNVRRQFQPHGDIHFIVCGIVAYHHFQRFTRHVGSNKVGKYLCVFAVHRKGDIRRQGNTRLQALPITIVSHAANQVTRLKVYQNITHANGEVHAFIRRGNSYGGGNIIQVHFRTHHKFGHYHRLQLGDHEGGGNNAGKRRQTVLSGHHLNKALLSVKCNIIDHGVQRVNDHITVVLGTGATIVLVIALLRDLAKRIHAAAFQIGIMTGAIARRRTFEIIRTLAARARFHAIGTRTPANEFLTFFFRLGGLSASSQTGRDNIQQSRFFHFDLGGRNHAEFQICGIRLAVVCKVDILFTIRSFYGKNELQIGKGVYIRIHVHANGKRCVQRVTDIAIRRKMHGKLRKQACNFRLGREQARKASDRCGKIVIVSGSIGIDRDG